jgi:uncharacterized membrane protein YbhN (UPF0104 family)
MLRQQSLISLLIFIFFIGLIEYYFSWQSLLTPWLRLDFLDLTVAILLTFFSYWLRAMRQYDYFHKQMRGVFAQNFKLMLQHNLLNNLLPMRSGEISFPLLMKHYFQIKAAHSIPALLWFRVLDLHTIFLFALFVAADYWLSAIASIILITGWLLLPGCFYYTQHRLRNNLPTRSSSNAMQLLQKSLDGLPNTNIAFWRSWFWTLVNWLVKLSVFAWVLGLFIDIPLHVAWICVIAGDLTSVLPIHGLAGVGTYEAGVVAGAMLFEIPADAILSAAVNLHLFILGSSLFGGGVSFFIFRRNYNYG